MIIGFAVDQVDIAALKEEGCVRIVRKDIRGLIPTLRHGDVLAVPRLSLMGDNVKWTTVTLASLVERGVHFLCVKPRIDSRTPYGPAYVEILLALKGLDREIATENRRKAIRKSADDGRTGGRPFAAEPEDIERALAMIDQGKITVTGAARLLGVSVSTMRRYKNGRSE